MTTAIETVGLAKSYGATPVLRGIDLSVRPGSVFSLLGANGAGKTTLVRILATLLRPDGGRAAVAGHDVVRDAAAVRRAIGLTGQSASVDDLLTGEENLVLAGRLQHLGAAGARRRAAELLERFDLSDAARRQVRTFSGGMRRRLDLAASLVTAPPVLFLDEPTTGLDPRSRRALWDVVRELAAAGTTVLLTTQYLEEADQLADRVAVLADGRVVSDGAPATLKQQVGRERLTVTVAEAADVSQAATLLASTDPAVDVAAGTVTVPLQDAHQLRDVLNRLADHGVVVRDVVLSAPTLDDVFFALVPASRNLEVSR